MSLSIWLINLICLTSSGFSNYSAFHEALIYFLQNPLKLCNFSSECKKGE